MRLTRVVAGAALAMLIFIQPLFAQGPGAAATRVVTHLSAGELRAFTDSLAARAAREPGRQVPGRPLGRDSVLAMFLLRRDTSGRPERHAQVADIFVVQAGRAVIVSGGRVEGAQLMEPGEWNGGRIVKVLRAGPPPSPN